MAIVEVRDRAKDIIISGGENISSIEVEGVLYRHPAVLEAAVVARPDAKWGKAPAPSSPSSRRRGAATADDLIAHCRAPRLTSNAPKTIVFAELPKTSTGKIEKHVPRAKARAL